MREKVTSRYNYFAVDAVLYHAFPVTRADTPDMQALEMTCTRSSAWK